MTPGEMHKEKKLALIGYGFDAGVAACQGQLISLRQDVIKKKRDIPCLTLLQMIDSILDDIRKNDFILLKDSLKDEK